MAQVRAPRALRVSLAYPAAGSDLGPAVVEPAAGDAGAPSLDRLDAGHAILREPGQPPVAVLLLPAARGRAPGDATSLEVVVRGWRLELTVEDAARATLRERAGRGSVAAGSARASEVRAIIPGRIASVAAVAGQPVVKGDPILVIEAMKMHNELRAPREGSVTRVAVQAGQTVEAGDLLVVIE